MSIQKPFNTINGLLSLHKVVKADFSPADNGFKLKVNSYLDKDGMDRDNVLWEEYPVVPASAFKADNTFFEFEKFLTTQEEGLFKGGVATEAPNLDDLDTVKATKWEQMKAVRESLESGGFDVEGVGRFDSDERSQNRIVGAVTAAQIALANNAPYSIDWTLSDNTTATLDAQGIIQVGLVMLAHINGVHQRSRALAELIQAATTAEEVNAIQWAPSAPADPAPVDEEDASGEA